MNESSSSQGNKNVVESTYKSSPTLFEERINPDFWKADQGNLFDLIDDIKNVPFSIDIYTYLETPDRDAGNLGVTINRSSFLRLFGNRWLDNYVINKMMCLFKWHNYYWNLWNPTNKRNHLFMTTETIYWLSYRKADQHGFTDYSYDSNVPIFEYDTLFIPANERNVHWFLIVVSMVDSVIKLYDPRPYSRKVKVYYMRLVLNWLCAEGEKKLPNFNRAEFRKKWKFEFVKERPKQTNGYDCGVFAIMMVDFLAHGVDLNLLVEEDMKTYRALIACHIVRNKLHYTLGNEIVDLSLDDD